MVMLIKVSRTLIFGGNAREAITEIGQRDLTNRNQFKKRYSYKIRTKSVRNYCVITLMIYIRSIYYWHTNVDLVGVRPPSHSLRENYQDQVSGWPHLTRGRPIAGQE